MYQSHQSLLGDALWSALCSLASGHTRPTRSLLLRQGDPGTHVLALTAGSAAITRRDSRGVRSLLAVRGAGELLGELALLDGGERTATVVAAEPCTVHTIPAPEFQRFTAENGLLQILLRHAVGRIREGDEIRQELAAAPVPVRLAAALIRLANPSGIRSDGPVTIRLTQEDLAQLIGVSRNSVVQALVPWRAEGWIRAGAAGGLVVTDTGPLHRIAAAT